MKISVVVPVYNELDNVALVVDQVDRSIASLPYDYELIFVDDGSTDGTTNRLIELSTANPVVRTIPFRKNYGQTAAMQAGIDFAEGDVIVTLDGDLQNDPNDIPMMLAKIEEGFDLVHGWRKDRKDRFLSRRLPSMIANRMISFVTGFPIHDLGCTLKAIRTDTAKKLELFGEMHRFIPILAHQKGARCAEVVTNHRARQFGQSKYGLSRTTRVLLDLMTVKFLTEYLTSPMKLFGRLGLACWTVAGIALLMTGLMKAISGIDMTGNPLLMMTVLSIMAGLQLFSIGVLGELNARIYFARDQRKSYELDQAVALRCDFQVFVDPETNEKPFPRTAAVA